MEKKDCENWLNEELNKLSVQHYKGTFYTIATLECKGKTLRIVVPVDEWCNECSGIGFESIGIKSIAAQCPWDMRETLISINTGITKVERENLMDLVDKSLV